MKGQKYILVTHWSFIPNYNGGWKSLALIRTLLLGHFQTLFHYNDSYRQVRDKFFNFYAGITFMTLKEETSSLRHKIRSGLARKDGKTFAHSEGICSLRLELRSIYANALEVACADNLHGEYDSSLEELETELWKYVYYICIEDYRHKMEKTESEESLLWLESHYKALLLEAIGFYSTLMQRFELVLGISVTSDLYFNGTQSCTIQDGDSPYSFSQVSNHFNAEKSKQLLFKFLIYLGDLHRYLQKSDIPAQSDVEKRSKGKKKTKNLGQSEARKFYETALKLENGRLSGHPFNQLAILDASEGNIFRAFYYYCRASCCGQFLSFGAAKDNLRSLCQQYGKIALSQLEGDLAGSNGSLPLFTKFILLQSLMYGNEGENVLVPVNHLREQFNPEFEGYLLGRSFSQNDLIYLITISVGLLHISKESGPPKNLRTIISVIFDILTVMLTSSLKFMRSSSKVDPGIGSTKRLLPAIHLIINWLCTNPTNKLTPSISANSANYITNLLEAGEDSIACTTLVEFLNSLQKLTGIRTPSSFNPQTCTTLSLPEEEDLFGFEPFSLFVSTTRKSLENQPGLAAQMELRIRKIIYGAQMLAKHSILPLAINPKADYIEFSISDSAPTWIVESSYSSVSPIPFSKANGHESDEDEEEIVHYRGPLE